jgi:pre-mRNA-splicing factor ATP-dependent RNA helicase DHX38/PRP16
MFYLFERNSGDILVFLTGQDDIECYCELIKERLNKLENVPPLDIMPLYSQLPSELQMRALFPSSN